jgi:hypothetical protein
VPGDRDFLRRLRKATQEACRQTRDREANRRLQDAVNWADLACVQAIHWEDDEGDSGYLVLIREAAPDAWKFRTEITRLLSDAGFPNIAVKTEW